MKIDKLPSGSYRIRKMIKGKTYSLTFDHKPTDIEIYQAILPVMEETAEGCEMKFEKAADEYISMKKNVISPATVRGYKGIKNKLSEGFKNLRIKDITQIDIQKEANRIALKCSPKTVRNYHGFISAVLGTFRPDLNISTTLPKKRKNEPHIPSEEDVKKLIEHAKTHRDGRYYIPVLLGCYGLSRSEICALSIDDLKGNIIHIHKGKVMDDNKEWIVKDIPKETERSRTVPISQELADLIREQGYIFEGHPNTISDYISDACKELKIEHFSLHKLRHFFCSKLSAENIDVETILALGGWSTDFVMKNVYRHKIDSKVKEASDKLTDMLFS